MTYGIVFAHLLNDFSGSPKVLLESIRACASRGLAGKLYVGSTGTGALSAAGIPSEPFPYARSRWRIVTLISYLSSQVALFFKLLVDRSVAPDAVVYVNTLLPFGAAIYGRLTGRRVIWHVHEITITPSPLRWMLLSIARWTASLVIYVSDAHATSLLIRGVARRRIHNALDGRLLGIASTSEYVHRRSGVFTVLMIASLRDYKGIPELVRLASALSSRADIQFELVLNDEQPAIDRYFSDAPAPNNLIVHARSAEVAPFYARASLLLNLSRVDLCVETFGLTILEAMAFGIPVIAPPVGGPPELITDGIEGFLVDSRDEDAILGRVLELCEDEGACLRMSRAGRRRAAHFTPSRFADEVASAVASVRRSTG